MLFSRIICFVAFSLTLGTSVMAKPITTSAASIDDISVNAAFTSLKSKTDVIIPQLRNLAIAGNATDDFVGPLIIELTSALQEAKGSFYTIDPISGGAPDSSVAKPFADLLEEIVETLDALLGNSTGITDFRALLVGIDTALAAILVGLDFVLAGVLTLVSPLLSGSKTQLDALDLEKTLALLSL